MQDQSRLSLDLRQHLERHFGQNPHGAMRPGHQPGEVQPGDILHHPPAVLDHMARPVHKPDPEQIIPRRPGLHPAGTRDIGRDHPAHRWLT